MGNDESMLEMLNGSQNFVESGAQWSTTIPCGSRGLPKEITLELNLKGNTLLGSAKICFSSSRLEELQSKGETAFDAFAKLLSDSLLEVALVKLHITASLSVSMTYSKQTNCPPYERFMWTDKKIPQQTYRPEPPKRQVEAPITSRRKEAASRSYRLPKYVVRDTKNPNMAKEEVNSWRPEDVVPVQQERVVVPPPPQQQQQPSIPEVIADESSSSSSSCSSSSHILKKDKTQSSSNSSSESSQDKSTKTIPPSSSSSEESTSESELKETLPKFEGSKLEETNQVEEAPKESIVAVEKEEQPQEDSDSILSTDSF